MPFSSLSLDRRGWWFPGGSVGVKRGETKTFFQSQTLPVVPLAPLMHFDVSVDGNSKLCSCSWLQWYRENSHAQCGCYRHDTPWLIHENKVDNCKVLFQGSDPVCLFITCVSFTLSAQCGKRLRGASGCWCYSMCGSSHLVTQTRKHQIMIRMHRVNRVSIMSETVNRAAWLWFWDIINSVDISSAHLLGIN